MGKSSSRSELTSKADRKFDKKVQFYSKSMALTLVDKCCQIKDSIASLSAKKAIGKKTKVKSRQKKLKVYDLSTLAEFLPDLKAPGQSTPAPPEFKLNCKTRQKLILKEGKQLNTVVNHPAFQADPLGSIFQHLQGTQPVVEEKPMKKPNTNGGKKKKGKKSKASSEPQSMDL